MTLILGIETSCDETAAAVIADGHEIRSNVVASQIELHRQYGGVFPEMASRQHVMAINPVIQQALDDAQVTWDDLAAIAVTYGPGLAGSLLVGLNVAKGLAYARGLPLIGVNHLEAHIATNWLDVCHDGPAEGSVSGDLPSLPGLSEQIETTIPPLNALDQTSTGGASSLEAFPLLCLIVSGGHTDLTLMNDRGDYRRLGSTIDDAAGEAFDKVARLLGLEYPGGPAIQRVAEQGDPGAFSFPRARLDRSLDFSFSGLKTAVLRAVQQYEPALRRPGDKVPQTDKDREPALHPQIAANLAASFQAAVVDVLVDKTSRAAVQYEVKGVLLAGGVAANQFLRARMREALPVPLAMPPVSLATDNATGVGVAGFWALQRGHIAGWDLDAVPSLRLG